MLSVSTCLHLALKLGEVINEDNTDMLLLGSAYQYSANEAEPEQNVINAYKEYKSAENSEKAFALGCLFRVWLDAECGNISMKNINKYDKLICDMEAVIPAVYRLKEKSFEGRAEEAMRNILALENEPMPLYLVPGKKKNRYVKKLKSIAKSFKEQLEKWEENRNDE